VIYRAASVKLVFVDNSRCQRWGSAEHQWSYTEMNSDNDLNKLLSRRHLLQSGAYAAGAAILAVTATRASAEPDTATIPKKSSQTQAGYQHVIMDSRKCTSCRHFQGAETCRVVEGKIGSDGVCRLYYGKKLVEL